MTYLFINVCHAYRARTEKNVRAFVVGITKKGTYWNSRWRLTTTTTRRLSSPLMRKHATCLFTKKRLIPIMQMTFDR